VYFPGTLRAIYSAAENMVFHHFTDTCTYIDPQIKERLIDFQKRKAVVVNFGRRYWSEMATAHGIIETERGLRFINIK
jgi:hypothetical protein